MVSQHAAKFGGQVHCGSRDIMILTYKLNIVLVYRKTMWVKGYVNLCEGTL